jgi:hypothetical protein
MSAMFATINYLTTSCRVVPDKKMKLDNFQKATLDWFTEQLLAALPGNWVRASGQPLLIDIRHLGREVGKSSISLDRSK